MISLSPEGSSESFSLSSLWAVQDLVSPAVGVHVENQLGGEGGGGSGCAERP